MTDTFVMVGKCRASAIFDANAQLTVTCTSPERSPFTVTFWTNYGGQFEIPVPLDLCVEGRGLADGIKEAGETFANWANGLNTLIALAVNADTGLLQPELIFDASPDKDEHQYFQCFIADEPIKAIPNRRIDIGLAQAVITAVAAHKEHARLRRAAAQYSHALSLWRPGREIECLAHLYMGVEAVSKAVLREHLLRVGMAEDELAVEWKVDNEDKLKRRRKLEAEVRRRLIFCDDTASYANARKVSDAFEHGYSDYDAIRKPAQDVIVRCARYLRAATINALNLDAATVEQLLGPKYVEPRGPVSFIRYLCGTLSGKAEQLAAPDQRYPIMHWHTKIKSVRLDTEGRYSTEPDEQLTANIGQGIQFHSISYEIWDGSRLVEHSPPIT